MGGSGNACERHAISDSHVCPRISQATTAQLPEACTAAQLQDCRRPAQLQDRGLHNCTTAAGGLHNCTTARGLHNDYNINCMTRLISLSIDELTHTRSNDHNCRLEACTTARGLHNCRQLLCLCHCSRHLHHISDCWRRCRFRRRLRNGCIHQRKARIHEHRRSGAVLVDCT
jgi:hypothetical protein